MKSMTGPVTCELNTEIKDERDQARKLHKEIMVGLTTTSVATCQQLEEARDELERAQVEVKVFKTWTKIVEG